MVTCCKDVVLIVMMAVYASLIIRDFAHLSVVRAKIVLP
jgi:hypothetical protein